MKHTLQTHSHAVTLHNGRDSEGTDVLFWGLHDDFLLGDVEIDFCDVHSGELDVHDDAVAGGGGRVFVAAPYRVFETTDQSINH